MSDILAMELSMIQTEPKVEYLGYPRFSILVSSLLLLTLVLHADNVEARNIDTGSPRSETTILGKERTRTATRFAFGDFNGDGWVDVAISLPRANGSDGSILLAGAVAILFGHDSSTPAFVDLEDQVPDVTIHGRVAQSAFGSTFAVGDINGDGFDDLAISERPPSGSGRPYSLLIWLGQSSWPSIIDARTSQASIEILGPMEETVFGSAIVVGDLNGDGMAELLVSDAIAPTEDGLGQAGNIYVYRGRQSWPPVMLANDSDTRVVGCCSTARIGGGLWLCDWNNDTLSDLVFLDSGGVSIVESPLPLGVMPLSDRSPSSHLQSDGSIATVACGDLNGDGRVDLAVSEPRASLLPECPGCGAVWVVDPSSQPTSVYLPTDSIGVIVNSTTQHPGQFGLGLHYSKWGRSAAPSLFISDHLANRELEGDFAGVVHVVQPKDGTIGVIDVAADPRVDRILGPIGGAQIGPKISGLPGPGVYGKHIAVQMQHLYPQRVLSGGLLFVCDGFSALRGTEPTSLELLESCVPTPIVDPSPFLGELVFYVSPNAEYLRVEKEPSVGSVSLHLQ